MEKVIELLNEKSKQLDKQRDILAQANKITSSKENEEKDTELRILIDEIETAIRLLKLKKEIEILEALIDDGRIKDPND